MRKGISPVVAVVLLIAIAVIAAIGVWYWVGAYTGKPATGGQSQVALSITDCNQTHVKVRNTGGIDAADDAFIFTTAGAPAGSINFSVTSIDAGKTGWVELCNTSGEEYTAALPIPAGVYDIFDDDYPDYQFTC